MWENKAYVETLEYSEIKLDRLNGRIRETSCHSGNCKNFVFDCMIRIPPTRLEVETREEARVAAISLLRFELEKLLKQLP